MNNSNVDSAELLDDQLGDWRFRWVGKVQKSPGVYALMAAPGELKAPSGQSFTFTDFMPAALFLNIAMAADRRANELRGELRPEEFVTRSGPITELPHHKCGLLFDFIEQSAVAAISSCQALEAYSNFVIRMELGEDPYIFKLPRRPKEQVPAEEIERYGELMEKMKTIVPSLLKIQPPVKKPFWSRLWEMKNLRDALIHPKFDEQMAAASRLSQHPETSREDPDSAFHKIVSGTSKDFSKSATQALDYFTRESGTPRWLEYPLRVNGIEPTRRDCSMRVILS